MKSVSLPLFTESRAAAEKPLGWPFLRLGFRPFYVGGALTAALLVPLWLAIFLGGLPWRTAVPGLLWHAHEMLFGFAAAIVIGFLMTACWGLWRCCGWRRGWLAWQTHHGCTRRWMCCYCR